MPGPRRFWGDGDPKKSQIIFGAFCEGDGGQLFSSILVLIGGVWFSARLSSESPSLIEALRRWNSFSPPWKPFEYFGVTLADCFRDNPEATLRAMRECCAKEIKIANGGNNFNPSNRLVGWRSLLSSLADEPARELRRLLKKTIEQLEKISFAEGNKASFASGSD